jgi:hypothetical protein
MPSTGFETVIPAIKRPKTYALDLTATGIIGDSIQLMLICFGKNFAFINDKPGAVIRKKTVLKQNLNQ